jgi:hypothetical protein
MGEAEEWQLCEGRAGVQNEGQMRILRIMRAALIVTLATALPVAAQSVQSALACAGGVGPCSGQVLTPEEIRLVLGFDSEADARVHYLARYGAEGQGLAADLGRYREIAVSYDMIYDRASCRGTSSPEPAGREVVLSRAADGGILWQRTLLYRQIVSPSEVLLIFGHCGPLLRHDGLAALDWVGAAEVVHSDDSPLSFDGASGFMVMGADRIVQVFAADVAVVGGREGWIVSLWERITDDGGAPVPRRDRPSATPPGGAEPLGGVPPAPQPMSVTGILDAMANAADPCAALDLTLAALDLVGETDLAAAARDTLAQGPAEPPRCLRILDGLYLSALGQPSGNPAMGRPFLWGLTPRAVMDP